jgi:hypothetical protein
VGRTFGREIAFEHCDPVFEYRRRNGAAGIVSGRLVENI